MSAVRVPIARLSEIARSIADGDHQAPPKAGNGIPFLTIAAINNGRLAIDRATRYVPESYFAALKPDRKPIVGDVLFSVTGSIAIPAIVDDPRPFVFQRHIAIIKPDPGIVDTRYLWHALQTPEVKEQARSVATGTAQLTIPLGALRGLLVPLPTLSEQRRIVAKLDSLSGKSKGARDHLDHIPRLVEKYKQAILAAAFTERASWPVGTVEEFLQDALIGLVRSKTDQSATSGVPYIRMNHFDLDGNWNELNLTHISITDDEMRRYELRPDDVLFNTRNSYELVGKVALWPDGRPRYVYNNNLLRLRFNDRLVPAFAFWWMISPQFRDYLQTVKSATTSVCAIYQRSIMAAPIYVPEKEMQHQIVRRITKAFAWIDRLASEITNARRVIEHLDQAVLAKAFRGELVPQDPNDEPANALLERIRAERKDTGPARRGRRMRAKASA